MNHQNMVKRSLYYWAQVFLHNKSLKTSEDYKLLKPAITVNVLNFNFLPFEKYFSMYTLCEEETLHRLTDVMALYFLEVPKLAKKPPEEMPLMEKWLGLCSPKFSMEEKEAIAMTEPAIKEAMEAAERFMSDETLYRQYLSRQAAILDYNSDMNAYIEKGRAAGIEEGRAEGEDKLLRLIDALYGAGKQKYISKLHADKNLRENLYKEFNIA